MNNDATHASKLHAARLQRKSPAVEKPFGSIHNLLTGHGHPLIDEATVRAMDHQAIMREIDLIRVVGKDRPVAVFEAVGYHNSETCPHLADLVGYFSQGLTAYRARDWQGAIGKFEAALAAHPTDQLSKIYIERCRHLLQNAPGGDWDGVWVLTEK